MNLEEKDGLVSALICHKNKQGIMRHLEADFKKHGCADYICFDNFSKKIQVEVIVKVASRFPSLFR